MDRRQFLKTSAVGAAALTASACKSKTASSEEAIGQGSGQMEMRINSKSGDKISLLGYGCMRWPLVKEEGGGYHIDQPVVNELVDYAYKHGVNYYDTSPQYLRGLSEAAAGEALSRYPRESYYIATKLSNFSDYSRKASMQMYQDSFKALRTNYIDYYLLHSIGGGGYPEFKARYEDNGMVEFLLGERKAGRIRNLGFSFHGGKEAYDLFLQLDEKYHWDFVQIQMNYLDWKYSDPSAEYLYAELEKRGIPVVIMEPLLGGRLAKLPAGVAQKLLEKDPTHSVASWAFRFAGSYPSVYCVLSGMTNMDVLRENVDTYSNFRPISPDDYTLLMQVADLLNAFPTVPCNDCQYCMPCPYGVNIPGIFLHYNDMVNTANVATSKEQKDFQRLRRTYLVSYDRAVETLRQADHCIHCHQCEHHCPQKIRIPDQLHRIGEYVEKLRRGEI